MQVERNVPWDFSRLLSKMENWKIQRWRWWNFTCVNNDIVHHGRVKRSSKSSSITDNEKLCEFSSDCELLHISSRVADVLIYILHFALWSHEGKFACLHIMRIWWKFPSCCLTLFSSVTSKLFLCRWHHKLSHVTRIISFIDTNWVTTFPYLFFLFPFTCTLICELWTVCYSILISDLVFRPFSDRCFHLNWKFSSRERGWMMWTATKFISLWWRCFHRYVAPVLSYSTTTTAIKICLLGKILLIHSHIASWHQIFTMLWMLPISVARLEL